MEREDCRRVDNFTFHDSALATVTSSFTGVQPPVSRPVPDVLEKLLSIRRFE